MRTSRWLAMLIAGAGSAAGVAYAAEPARLLSEARHRAAGYAITMDIVTHQLTRSCAAFGGKAAEGTDAARRGWSERNGVLVIAAHRYLRRMQQAIARQDGVAAGEDFYERRKADLQSGSQSSLQQLFPPDADAFATCARIATEVAAGSLDLSTDAAQHSELQAIATALPAVIPK